jgi:predicted alpha/beta hydrolase
MPTIETTTVETKKGHQLISTVYSPENVIKGGVLIVPAMGVTQKYYASFATWLAGQGYRVITFDYSGIGLSQSGHLRDIDVNISDWAGEDCAAMLGAASNKAGGKPIYWIGHSLGGQILGLVPNSNLITKAVIIASGCGYWLENSPSLKWRVWWLWYFVVPIAIKLYGYFPGKMLRKVGDLPAGVMSQWRQWCLHPEYVVGVEGEETREKYSKMSAPITSISFTDDELMSLKNINSLQGFYVSSLMKMKRIAPEDIASKHIGHFGFFKDKFETSLWESYLLAELYDYK